MLYSATADVKHAVLPNGLRVLIKVNRATPIAAVLAHVNIGYFHEPDRWNGLSHVIEHMFFKGTQRRPGKEQIAQEIRALGGTINAGTYYEETSYYIVLPCEHLEKGIEIQADTFLRSRFDSEELAKELEVIIQESKQKRDNPSALLLETMYACAYDRHRIRRWRIGSEETLRSFRRDDILAFIENTYRPENIVVAIVGDVDTERALEAVGRYWSALPRGILLKEPSPEEPEREEFRYERMRGDIRQRLVQLGFHAPPLLHPDSPPLMALGALLSDGRSSRLYRALKEEQRLVTSVWAGYEGFSSLGVFTISLETVRDDPLAAEQALFGEVARLLVEPIGEEELERVKTRIESRYLFAQEEVLGMARTLASYEALGDYRLADEMLNRLQAVTAEDVKRVAAQYLSLHRATLVEYLPHTANIPERAADEVFAMINGRKAGIAHTLKLRDNLTNAPVSGLSANVKPRPASTPTAGEILEARLPGGATLLYRERRDLPIVAFHVLFPGGKRAETPQTAGLTSLMLRSALKGTKNLTAEQIAQRVESLGSSIGISLTPDYFGFSMKLLAERVPEGLAVLKEVISHPIFPAEEVEKEKQSIYGEIRRRQDSMFSHAFDQFNHACYGDQPYGLPSAGIAEAVAAQTSEALRTWHRQFVRGAEAVIAVVGDIDYNTLVELLADVLPEGESSTSSLEPIKFAPPGEQIVRCTKQQTAFILGFPGVPVTNDDRHALDVLSEIASGLAGRFFQAVRGDNALAYAVTAYHRARRDAGNFITYTATSPAREAEARAIILAECEKLAQEPVKLEELASAKEAIRGAQMIGTQTFGAQAAEMATLCLYGLPTDAPERYLARVRQVNAEELMEVAGRYLHPERAWLGVVRGEE